MMRLMFFLLVVLLSIQSVRSELIYSYSNNMAAKFAEPEEQKLYVYKLKHQDLQAFADQIKLLFPEEKIIAYKNNSSVGVYTTSKKYRLIQASLDVLDCQVEQIKIEVEVVEMNRNDLSELGFRIDTEKSGQSSDSLLVLDDMRVFARIKLARQNGHARIKANPTLVVKDNCTAIVKIGDKVPIAVPDKDKGTYSVSYLDAGIKLQIKPRVISGNYVETSIQPEVSSIKGWKATSAGEYPVISTKEAQTEVKVMSGQLFMIAGLTSKDEKTYSYEVPFFSSIPFLGNFFKFNKSENEDTEIVFCIRPTILNP